MQPRTRPVHGGHRCTALQRKAACRHRESTVEGAPIRRLKDPIASFYEGNADTSNRGIRGERRRRVCVGAPVNLDGANVKCVGTRRKRERPRDEGRKRSILRGDSDGRAVGQREGSSSLHTG